MREDDDEEMMREGEGGEEPHVNRGAAKRGEYGAFPAKNKKREGTSRL